MSSTNYAVSIIVILILGLIVKESTISDSIKIILCTMVGLVAYIALNIDNTEKFGVVRKKWITTQMILDMIDTKIAALPSRSDSGSGSTGISNIQIESMINSKLESLPAYGLTSVEISSIRTLLSAYLSGSMATSRPSFGSSSGSSDGSSSGYASSQPASQSLTSLANFTEDYIENLKKLARLNETKIDNLLALAGITSDTAMTSAEIANLKALAGISALTAPEATNLKALAGISATTITTDQLANLKAFASLNSTTEVPNLKALAGISGSSSTAVTPVQVAKLLALMPLTDSIASKSLDNMPIGSIIMWSGSIEPKSEFVPNGVPVGWKVCNGQSPTPDLRGRFILGVSEGAGGTTIMPDGLTKRIMGDKSEPLETTYLIPNNLPQHTHKGMEQTVKSIDARFSDNRLGGNTPAAWDPAGVAIILTECSDCGEGITMTSNSKVVYKAKKEANDTKIHSAGNPFSIMPPFYVLAFIMKVAS